MTVLVAGATGNIGKEAVTALLARPPGRHETYIRDTAERWSRENLDDEQTRIRVE